MTWPSYSYANAIMYRNIFVTNIDKTKVSLLLFQGWEKSENLVYIRIHKNAQQEVELELSKSNHPTKILQNH